MSAGTRAAPNGLEAWTLAYEYGIRWLGNIRVDRTPGFATSEDDEAVARAYALAVMTGNARMGLMNKWLREKGWLV
jgi:hypothetical protein